MLIRWIHTEHTGALAPFGTLHIRWSLAQEYAANMLYHYLITTNIPHHAALLPLLHQLLVTLVKQKFTDLEMMTCSTDYSLCMGSLADNGGFLLASTNTKTCEASQPMEKSTTALDEREGTGDGVVVVQFQEVEEEFVDCHGDDMDLEEGESMLLHKAEDEWDFEKK
ncbi:uncharacterized protein BJ212DRAFT_1303725 [Suillus subaureus]|uniref:Uncharacterized protein n=1 Tax=Suillus subaureus TaxID=48587 RepID=A0A9P7J6U8_9AGAM|nr:uncharacterized protein BJ212DRAFT_1303725 [Suillus subaureus]KAG1806211.1 hypothetical protein BJ212DRAFT_1303725 [Suillus subaureus]